MERDPKMYIHSITGQKTNQMKSGTKKVFNFNTGKNEIKTTELPSSKM